MELWVPRHSNVVSPSFVKGNDEPSRGPWQAVRSVFRPPEGLQIVNFFSGESVQGQGDGGLSAWGPSSLPTCRFRGPENTAPWRSGGGIPGYSSCNCRSPVMEGCSVLPAACRYVVRLEFAVLPQLRQVFAKMEVNIPLVASKARLELSIGISAPQPPGAYDLAGPPNRSVCL